MLECAFENWSPVIGDPTVMGWVTVATYVAATLVCARVAWAGDFPERLRDREELFWGLLALLLAFLAVNKQLDLQSLLTASARCLAIEQGWYENRRPVQLAFIAAVAASAALAGICGAFLMRRSLPRVGLALAGLCLLLGFVLIRAAGFHHVDRLISTEVLSVRANWVLELSGLALILVAGLRHPRYETGAAR